MIGLAALLSCALSMHYLDELRINHGEFYALILFATSGMMLLVAAVDMLPVFLGLELMSIPIYVLAGFDRRRLRSNESAMKYFLIGSFASAILLYGVALLYGVTGSTSFAAIRAGVRPGEPARARGPRRSWWWASRSRSRRCRSTSGRPTSTRARPSAVTAFMTVTVKLAAFAAFLRVLALSFEPLGELLANLLWVLAARDDRGRQRDGGDPGEHQAAARLLEHRARGLSADRLRARHARRATRAVVFYLIAYLFMNLGAFGVVVGAREPRPGLRAHRARSRASRSAGPGSPR